MNLSKPLRFITPFICALMTCSWVYAQENKMTTQIDLSQAKAQLFSQHPPSIAIAVNLYLDAAEKAPKNGDNPQFDYPKELPEIGAEVLMDAIRSGPTERARNAASLLAQHPDSKSIRLFWRSQLESHDVVVRSWALMELAGIADNRDFEAVLSQGIRNQGDGDTSHTLAVRLRDWHDRRAVPFMIELLASSDGLVSHNAAASLGIMPGVPKLEADYLGTESHPQLPIQLRRSDPVAPYLRWWAAQGAKEFESELIWWEKFKASTPPTPQQPQISAGKA